MPDEKVVDPHENCYRFQNVDFETGEVRPAMIGRIQVGESYTVRIFFGPKGLMLLLSQEAVDAGAVVIMPMTDIRYFDDLQVKPIGAKSGD